MQRRIPTLDGWRGVAILCVIGTHLGGAFPRLEWPKITQGLGGHGVALFFVLSGFLITSRLLEEQQKSGSITLKSFYTRRFFRLMPCAWCYLGVVLLLQRPAHFYSVRPQEVVGSLLFFRNVVDQQGIHPATGHFWSLSIEEQFYLVWPPLLVACSAARARWIAVGGALAVAFYRSIHWSELNSLPTAATFGTQFRADALLLGCAVALFLPDLRRHLRAWMSIPGVLTLSWCLFHPQNLIPLYEAGSIGLLLAVTSEYPKSPLSRILEWRPLAFVGTLSYSLYVWQQVVFYGAPAVAPLFSTPIAAVIAMIALGLLSYFYIEQPCTRLGRWLSKRTTTRERILVGAIEK